MNRAAKLLNDRHEIAFPDLDEARPVPALRTSTSRGWIQEELGVVGAAAVRVYPAESIDSWSGLASMVVRHDDLWHIGARRTTERRAHQKVDVIADERLARTEERIEAAD